MNLGETRSIFGLDAHTVFEEIGIEKKHLNVSTITVLIAGIPVRFGYSYQTIVYMSLEGYQLRTKQYYSNSTQKHKSQLIEGRGRIIDLTPRLFNALREDILRGNIPDKETLCNKIKYFDLISIKTKEEPATTWGEVLERHIFIDPIVENVQDEIKRIVRQKLFRNNTVSFHTNRPYTVKTTQSGYLWEGRIYKNLSFLNKVHIGEVREVI